MTRAKWNTWIFALNPWCQTLAAGLLTDSHCHSYEEKASRPHFELNETGHDLFSKFIHKILELIDPISFHEWRQWNRATQACRWMTVSAQMSFLCVLSCQANANSCLIEPFTTQAPTPTHVKLSHKQRHNWILPNVKRNHNNVRGRITGGWGDDNNISRIGFRMSQMLSFCVLFADVVVVAVVVVVAFGEW